MDDNKNTLNSYNILYKKYITGVATRDEISQLAERAKALKNQHQEFAETSDLFRKISALKQMREVNTPLAARKFNRRISVHLNKKNWFHYWQKIAAVLIFPLFILSAYFIYIHFSTAKIENLQHISSNEISTMPGLRSTFVLPDGTRVWLNGNTKITYPLVFSGAERRVRLSGEAYFEVAKNMQKPFIVDMDKLQVQAIGTAFNCNCYPNDNFIQTALTEGKVKVTKFQDGKPKGEYFLVPGQVIVLNQSTNQFLLNEGNLDKYLSWRSGRFVFRNDPLEEVCKKLGRWFNADIIIKDEKLKQYSFTGTFQEEGLVEIFDLISLTSPIKVSTCKRKSNNVNEYEKLRIEIMSK